MIYFLLISIAFAVKPILVPHKLEPITVNMIVDEEKQLYEDTNCFQIFLWRRSSVDRQTSQYTLEDLDLLSQEENKLEGVPGCVAVPRQFPTNQHLRMGLPANESIFYTDMIVLQNRALLIRNDLTLQEVNLDKDKFAKTQRQQKLNIAQTKTSHPIFIRNQNNNRVYIVSESGGVSIPDWISIGASNFFINVEPFLKRNILYDAFLWQNKIYLACGNEGLDVYKYENGLLLHEKVVLRINGQHLTAMDVSGDENYLYVLDHEHGLYVCDYEFNMNFRVPILKGSDFDHYNSTFFIVAESVNRQDYAIEVFLNFTDNTYYLNHYFIDEMQFYDVKVYEKYAILIGYEAHKIVQHSIYHDFIRQSTPNYFEFPQLLQLDEWDNFTLGLSKRELRLMIIAEIPTHIECQSNQRNEEHYLVAQFLKKGTSPYEAIEIFQQFTIMVDDVSMLSKANLVLLALITIIVFFIVCLVIFGMFCYRKCKNRISALDEEKKVLTKQHNSDKDEGPAQELTSM